MAAAQSKATQYAFMVVTAVATVFFSLGLARHELDGKEDSAVHDKDLATLRSELALKTVRDSAERAEIRRILLDVACDANPKRGYCAARRAP